MANIYEIVKENLIAKIEKQMNTPKDEKTIWIKPWSIPDMIPFNHVTERNYSGVNCFLLAGEGNEFLTFNQNTNLHEKNDKVKLRKGSKGHIVIFFKWLDKKNAEDNSSGNNEDTEEKIPMLRYYKVFSVSDVEGLELKYATTYEHTLEERETQLNDALFSYLHREEIAINFTDTGRAFYRRSTHSIDIPKGQYFKEYSRFLDTLAHEIGHSTGKALGRKEHTAKGDDTYSYEELVAEFTANLIMARYGLTSEVTEEQSVAYLASWFSNIKNCPAKLLVSDFSQAERAANFILGNSDTDSEELQI